MPGEIEKKLEGMGLTLMPANPPGPFGARGVRVGNILFMSGTGPRVAEGVTPWKGKLGRDLTVEQGYEAAKAVGMSLLTNIKAEIGDLDKVKRVVKLLAMINCDPEFGQTPAVANGCSDLFISLWGENGKHGRSAVGMGSLPNGIPVEIEGIFEVED